MPPDATPLEWLEAYRRVGVVTADDHHAAAPESRPGDYALYLSRTWYVEALAQLPDGAGPERVRAHLRAALDQLNADTNRRLTGE